MDLTSLRPDKMLGGVVVQKYFLYLKKMCVGGGEVMPKYFMDVKKCCGGGGWAKISFCTLQFFYYNHELAAQH